MLTIGRSVTRVAGPTCVLHTILLTNKLLSNQCLMMTTEISTLVYWFLVYWGLLYYGYRTVQYLANNEASTVSISWKTTSTARLMLRTRLRIPMIHDKLISQNWRNSGESEQPTRPKSIDWKQKDAVDLTAVQPFRLVEVYIFFFVNRYLLPGWHNWSARETFMT